MRMVAVYVYSSLSDVGYILNEKWAEPESAFCV